MCKLLLLLCLGLESVTLAIRSEYHLQDGIRGAVLASAMADGFANLVMKKRQSLPVGSDFLITSFEDLPENDWFYDRKKLNIAAYSESTVVAWKVIEVSTFARKTGQTKETFALNLAKKLNEIPSFYEHDLLRAYRRQSDRWANSADNLKAFLDNGLSLSSSFADNYDSSVAQENDSGALMRAWPLGLVFFDEIEVVQDYADVQTIMTHRHPAARAAGVALATGVAYALRGEPVGVVVEHMINAAAQFENLERRYKAQVKKIEPINGYEKHLIDEEKMFTSDMIRYAYLKALEEEPQDVLGGLYGYKADEAIAAAVYCFVRNAHDIRKAMREAAHAPGNTTLIASIAGALIGAHIGMKPLWEEYGFELEVTEHINALQETANDLLVVVKDFPPYTQSRFIFEA